MKTLVEQNTKKEPLVADHNHHHQHNQHTNQNSAGGPIISKLANKQQVESLIEKNNNLNHTQTNISNNNNNNTNQNNGAKFAVIATNGASVEPRKPADLPGADHDHKQQQRQYEHQAAKVVGKLESEQQLERDKPMSSVVAGEVLHKKAAESKTNKQQQQRQQQQQQQRPRPELGLIKKLTLDGLLYVIRGVIALYDLISQPVFYLLHDVGSKRRRLERALGQQHEPGEPESAWRQVDIERAHLELEARIDSFDTYDSLMRSSFLANSESPCYGYRQLLAEQQAKQADSGKVLRQVRLSAYRWISFGQFERQIEAAKAGLLLEGVRAGHRVLLFADTRPEWQICSQALVRLGAVLGTMYSTLGVDGIVHTLNETQASHVITQRDKVERLLDLADQLPRLRRVIYFEGSLHLPAELDNPASGRCEPEAAELRARQADADRRRFGARTAGTRLSCASFSELLGAARALAPGQLEQLERANEAPARTKDSLAVIMYTSGSTGTPKGVLISHRNIIATIKSFSYVTKDFIRRPRENTCAAYLPLAHIFEFCIESVMLYHGVRYGFATPHTLTDKSPGLAPGERGDLALLRPTVMIMVPLVLDRVVQGVRQTLRAGPYFKERLVEALIEYKIKWQRRHYATPLVDRLVCNKIAAALGGRAKWVICGSAPLSHQTQVFVRAALNLHLPQGFGTTETCAATSCQLFDDQSTENVGLPLAGAQIKLEPWLEGNYRPSDRPRPRGEIVVGGDMIALGYFNLDQQTRDSFFTDAHGTRWYRTGDIGEFLPNGQLRIIDRKKDLVKLQNGEYISLGRVESTLKSNPYTENFCVYASSAHNFVVALGPASEPALRQLARQLVDEHERRESSSPATTRRAGELPLAQSAGERDSLLAAGAVDELRELLATESCEPHERWLARLCANRLVCARVLAHLERLGRERNLLSLEIPRKLLLVAEDWTEDKNLVTAAMKIRRNYVYKRYEHQLDQLYRSPAATVAPVAH